jgi:lipopolysaccharide transport system permease protein
MWQYRDLIRNLTLADLKNRYQNTFLGFFWSLLSPLLLTGVLYFVFRHLFGQEENYLVSTMTAVMALRFFGSGTSLSLSSIVSKPSLVTKVYLPRQILVLSSALTAFISSLLEFLVLILIVFVASGHLPPTALLFPLLHFLYFWLVFGVGLVLSSLYVYFRDLNQIWEVILNVLFFACPIIYPLSIVPAYLMPYYMLNPLTRLIIMYRDVMVAGKLPEFSNVIFVVAVAAAAYFIGSLIFNRLQRRFAEEL